MYKYILVFFLLTSTALAHSWYPRNCCSDNDCHPVPCEELGEDKDGQITWNGFTFKKERTYSSQDGKCHVCHSTGYAYCAFIQQGS